MSNRKHSSISKASREPDSARCSGLLTEFLCRAKIYGREGGGPPLVASDPDLWLYRDRTTTMLRRYFTATRLKRWGRLPFAALGAGILSDARVTLLPRGDV